MRALVGGHTRFRIRNSQERREVEPICLSFILSSRVPQECSLSKPGYCVRDFNCHIQVLRRRVGDWNNGDLLVPVSTWVRMIDCQNDGTRPIFAPLDQPSLARSPSSFQRYEYEITRPTSDSGNPSIATRFSVTRLFVEQPVEMVVSRIPCRACSGNRSSETQGGTRLRVSYVLGIGKERDAAINAHLADMR
jgi:hypothetical protein